MSNLDAMMVLHYRNLRGTWSLWVLSSIFLLLARIFLRLFMYSVSLSELPPQFIMLYYFVCFVISEAPFLDHCCTVLIRHSLSLHAYFDAGWADNPDTRRSFIGFCIFWLLISWRSKRRDIVSCSSTKTEYRAMADTVLDLRWLRDLWDMGVPSLLMLSCIVIPRVPLLSPPILSFTLAQSILRSIVILLDNNMRKAWSLFPMFLPKLS